MGDPSTKSRSAHVARGRDVTVIARGPIISRRIGTLATAARAFDMTVIAGRTRDIHTRQICHSSACKLMGYEHATYIVVDAMRCHIIRQCT